MAKVSMNQEQQAQLKKNIRCCISCIFPCGAFDVVRIVHSNGYVEELACTVRAADVIHSHPKHLLKKPSFDPTNHRPTVVDVPPDALLHRGKIYFLIPAPPPPPQTQSQPSDRKKTIKRQVAPRSSSSTSGFATSSARSSTARRRQQSGSGGNKSICGRTDVSDQYLSEILSEKVVSSMGSRERRRGRVGVWRPHLESITEAL